MNSSSKLLKILLAIFILATAFLSYKLVGKKNVCGNYISKKYKVMHPLPSDTTKCRYIILTDTTPPKIKGSSLYSNWFAGYTDKDNNLTFARPIEVDVAVTHIKEYNEKYNADLRGTSFIDLGINELLVYLINSGALSQNTKNDSLRIYLGYRENGTGQKGVSAILVSKFNGKESFVTDKELKPLDWGSLCPPPDANCDNVDTKNGELFKRAKNASSILTMAYEENERIRRQKP